MFFFKYKFKKDINCVFLNLNNNSNISFASSLKTSLSLNSISFLMIESTDNFLFSCKARSLILIISLTNFKTSCSSLCNKPSLVS